MRCTHLLVSEKKELMLSKSPYRGLGWLTLLLFLIANIANAQTYVPTTAAGNSTVGLGATQLNSPSGVFIDTHGNLFVADQKNHRIQKFPPNSTSITAGTTVAGTSTSGTASTQLSSPYGVYVDASDFIYVADFANNRIQKFPPNSTSGTAGTTVAGTGTSGTGVAQLTFPTDVFVHEPGGEIFVADVGGNRIQKFPANSSSGTAGTTVAGISASLSAPITLYVDGPGNLFVSEFTNHRIKKFSPNSTSTATGTIVAGTGATGSTNTQLAGPYGVFVDGSGNIFVADNGNHRIQKFPPNSTAGTAGTTVAGTGASGSGPTQLNSPTGLYVDGNGNIFVADYGNNRVQKWIPAIVLQTSALPNPVAAGSTIALSVTATGGGTTTYSYTWTAPAGITLPPSTNTSALSGTVSCAISGPQTLTVTVAGLGGIPVSTSLVSFSVVGTTPPPPTVMSLSVDETNCPVRIVGQADGTSFVFTGPDGYVFSNVFRTGGTHTIVAEGIKKPGVYTLTSTNTTCGLSATSTQTVVVSRSCP